ncbi:hypothetical protein NM688_g4797 [Phlebia brevispora]|uniref:Uncharacterized protein n=1 Tax=Phlebia brevispora TaxID=194682 RepID=A0ACC1T208_9APHY|nr:hypothetical protein NM688_g4797 [Phlebia brevispora]
MPPFVPTPREIFLLGLLLTGLLIFSTTIHPSTLSVSDLSKLRTNYYPTEDEVEPPPSTFESQYSLQALNVPLRWGLGQVPETQIVAHVPGWTIFDRLYFVNGTFYVVSDSPENLPDRKNMISSGIFIANGAEEEAKRDPTDRDMRIIDTDTARRLFDTQAERLDGVTLLVNDPKQFPASPTITTGLRNCSSVSGGYTPLWTHQ